MGHYAFLDSSNIVTSVIPGKDETDTSHDWEEYYGQVKGQTCKRTSFNTQGGVHLLGGTPFRKNFAGIGHTYDPVRDAFYMPQPYPSYTLDEASCLWNPPTPKPNDGKLYQWDEPTLAWVEIST